MLLRIAVVVLAPAYVIYRLSLAVKIAHAKRRGEAEREQALRRQAFWALQGVLLLLLLGVLLFLALLGINAR